jgi:hypothetical protein
MGRVALGENGLTLAILDDLSLHPCGFQVRQKADSPWISDHPNSPDGFADLIKGAR